MAATTVAALLVVVAGCDRAEPAAGQPAGTVGAPDHTSPSPPRRPAPLPPELRQAAQLMSQGRLAAARDLAHGYAGAHPREGRAPLLVALTYHQAGNHEPAVPHFQRAAEIDPHDGPTRRYYGECLFMLGDMAGARAQYQAWVEAEPGEPDAHHGLGLVDLEEARLDEAERRFRRSIELYEDLHRSDPHLYQARAPGLARSHARLADVHFARDEYRAARDELLASTRINPGAISAFYALSLVYRRLGEEENADAAMEHYEAAVRAIVEQEEGG